MRSKVASLPLAWRLGLSSLLSRDGLRSGNATPISSLAIAVAVLVATLSVVNGFEQVLRERLFALVPQITLSTGEPLAEWMSLIDTLKTQIGAELVAAEPVVYLPAILSADGRTAAALVQGVRHGSGTEAGFEAYLRAGRSGALGNGGIVLGDALAQRLKIGVSDTLSLLSGGGRGRAAHGARFTVRALVDSGTGMDVGLALIDFERGAELMRHPGMASALQVRLSEPLDAPRLAARLERALGPEFAVAHWVERFGPLFESIRLSKQLVGLLLAAVVAIAVFNVAAMLSVLSGRRRSQIALLRTLGAPPSLILRSVIVQGAALGTVGIALGALCGTLLSMVLDDAALALEQYFGFSLLAEGSYPLDHLPTAMDWPELLTVCGLALLLCVAASVYPAWRAAKLPPAEVLR